MAQKKLMKKLSCWLRTDKVFVYFMRLKTRALKYAVFWPRECREQVQKMGHRFRADVHKITSFFSAAVPRLFGHGGFCLKIGGMATAAAGAEDTPGTAHEVATEVATKVTTKVASQFKLRHPLRNRQGGTDEGRGAANAKCNAAPRLVPNSLAQTSVCADE